MGDFIDLFLERRMDSEDGKELKLALESKIAEEKLCLDQFKIQINHCKKQIVAINKSLANGRDSQDLMIKKKAFEEDLMILNVAAQCQLCSFETKEKQYQLYFEKDEYQRSRLAAEAYVLIYERCDDLQHLTGKIFQDVAALLLNEQEMEKFKAVRKQLCRFYEEEKPILSKVRNNVGAHRDYDFMKQMEILEGLGWSDTIDRLHRFEKVTLEFGQSLKPLMDAGLKQIGRAFGE